MEPSLNPIEIELSVKREQVNAWDRLRLRQTAEYTAKGVEPGDNPDLDKKFQQQKKTLYKKMLKREQWIKELQATEQYDQIKIELAADDPLDMNQFKDGTRRPPEPDARSDYIRAFNTGYRLRTSEPGLAKRVAAISPGDDSRLQGLHDGMTQNDKEHDKEIKKDIEQDIWKELSDTDKDITRDRSRSRDIDKDVE